MSLDLIQRIKALTSRVEALEVPKPAERSACQCGELKDRLLKLEMQYRALNARTSRKVAD